MGLDLRLVEIFCSVFDARSFSKAAVGLGLSQPTVSGHIKALESRLDCRLFDRLGREIEPTPAGHLLYRYGRRIVSLKLEATRALERFLGRIEGQLSIGASSSAGSHLLPRQIADYHRRHPGVRIRMSVRSSDAVVRAVTAGEVEVGFVGARDPATALTYGPYGRDRLALLVPPGARWLSSTDPATLEALRRVPLLIRESGSGTRATVESELSRLGLGFGDLRVEAELGSTAAILEGVAGGFGAAFVSMRAARRALAAGEVETRSIDRLTPIRQSLYSVIDRRRAPSALREAFLADLDGPG